MARDKQAKRERVDLIALGAPVVHSGLSAARLTDSERDLYALEVPTVSDDTRRGRLVELSVMVDGAFLRQLVASARASGWTG